MPHHRSLAALLATFILAPGAASAACLPGEGERLILAAQASPAARALLGPAAAGPLPIVLAQANGAALAFVLDTGSNLTLLRPEAAVALGLSMDPDRSTPITGVGGTSRMPNAVMRHFQIGRRVFQNLSVPVAPGSEDEGGIAGIVGADLLRQGALELDLAAGRAVLHDSPGCIAAPPPWPAEAIPAEVTGEGLVVIPLRLNGRPARALLDTGAVRTVLRQDRITDFGIPASALGAPAAGTVFGTGGEAAAFRIHEGATLKLGEYTTAAMPIVIAPLPPSLPVDLVLGQDILGTRRLLLSYAARRLWVGPSAR
ncbi:retropepsin-like aspartic protease [Roseomonas indoligenes]|uniref:Clan AA aspartic protease n=1 Tax=Roseomonas indoligenes TaxID=2820811 RepID=A0A940MQN8_9PROT|nr:retropepsin-like aspartic protease [Pararoseomonas indoligenes]MBP0492243.1 clan AA aspartic protease [Pararoseomonas indoligenes]